MDVIVILAGTGREVVGVSNRERSLHLGCGRRSGSSLGTGCRRDRLDLLYPKMRAVALAAQGHARALLQSLHGRARQRHRGSVVALQLVMAARRVLDAILDDQLRHGAGDRFESLGGRGTGGAVLKGMRPQRRGDEQCKERRQGERPAKAACFIYDCTWAW